MTDDMRETEAAVIGGGPAGAQCALWLHRLGIRTVLVEKEHLVGGLQAKSPFTNSWVATALHDTPARELAAAMDANLAAFGVPVLNRAVTKVSRLEDGLIGVEASGLSIRAAVAVIATGTRMRTSGHEDGKRVFAGLPAVGEFSAAPSRVAVWGGGDAAFESYGILSSQGHDVRVFARSVRACRPFRESVPDEHLMRGDWRLDSEAMAMTGDEGAFSFDHAFVLHGWQAVLPALEGLDPLLGDGGSVVTDRDFATSEEGLYAVGDVVAGLHPCVSTALGSGAHAAVAIQKRLDL